MALFGIDKTLYAKSEQERQVAEEKATQLQHDLATATSKLVDLECRVAELQASNETLSQTVAARDASLEELDAAVAAARTKADRLAAATPYSADIVAALDGDGETDDAEAFTVAAGVVKARLADQVTATRANVILNQDEQALRAAYGSEVIAEVDANLTAIFENDGTFEQHRREVRDSIYAARRDTLLASDKEHVLANLQTPTARQVIEAEIRQDPDFVAELATYRQQQIEALRAEWDHEAIQAGEQAALEEIMASKDTYVAEKAAEWATSADAEKFRAKNRKKLEADWEKEAADKIAAEIGDEQLATLLQEKATSLAAEEEKSKLYRELLDHMDREGIDMRHIKAGSLTNIYLGTIDEYEANKTKKPRIVAARIIRTVANGDGAFTVNEDTLNESVNAYSRRFAIKPGTVVRFGREVTVGEKQETDPHVRRNVPLVITFGDGKTDTSIDPVVNVLVDSCSADTTIATIQLPYSQKTTFWFPKQS